MPPHRNSGRVKSMTTDKDWCVRQEQRNFRVDHMIILWFISITLFQRSKLHNEQISKYYKIQMSGGCHAALSCLKKEIATFDFWLCDTLLPLVSSAFWQIWPNFQKIFRISVTNHGKKEKVTKIIYIIFLSVFQRVAKNMLSLYCPVENLADSFHWLDWLAS